MANGNISYEMTPEDKTSIKDSIEGVRAKMPYLVSLTKDERKKLRKIGPNRLGYATEVNLASNAHKPALAAGFDLEGYNRSKALLSDVSEVYSLIESLYDAVGNTMMALGADVMKYTDTAYDYLKVHANKSNDQSMNSTMKKISAILRQTRKTQPKA